MLNKLTQVYDVLRFKLERVMNFAERNAGKLVFVLIAVYTLVFSSYTIFMHYAFKTYAWDLGIFTQSLWTTVNKNKLFYYTIELPVNPSGSFLGTHFSPILFLIVPIYALFQSPLTLLILQSFVLAVGAMPVYWIAKEQLDDKLSGLGLAAAYLLYPALHSVNCFDFHTQAFIPVFFLLAFYYINKREWFRGLIFTFLLLSTVEFSPILVIFLAIYFLLKDITKKDSIKIDKASFKKILGPIILIVIAVTWFYLAFHVMNNINPLKGTGLPGNWTFWGSNLSEVFINILSRPLEAITFMVTPIEKVFYFFSLLAPLLMLPMFSLEFLCALPWLIGASLSEYRFYYHFYFQYSAFAIGQLFIATIFGIRKLFFFYNDRQRKLKLQRKIITLIIVTNIVLSIALSPLGLPRLGTRKVEITPHANLLHDVLKLVSNDASIATQNDIFPHVAQREHTYILSRPMPVEVDLILIDMKSSHFLIFGGFLSAESPNQVLEEAIKNGKYGVFASADGILLFKKDYNDSAVLFVPRVDVFSSNHLIPVFRNSKVVVDPTSYSGRTIVHEPNDSNGTIWFGPYAYFFTGEYSATFRIKTKSENLNLIIDVADSGEIICEKRLNSSDFVALGEWQEFTLNFTIVGLKRMEFRGFCISNNTHVALDFIKVTQLGS